MWRFLLRVAWAIGWRLVLALMFLGVAQALFPDGGVTAHILGAFGLYAICTQGLTAAGEAQEAAERR